MVTLDKIRLTGLLTRSPAPAGLLHGGPSPKATFGSSGAGWPSKTTDGDWTVPTVTQHTAGQDENSSDWIGIGGGCADSGCTAGDETLIQTGTEQDFSGGQASYSAGGSSFRSRRSRSRCPCSRATGFTLDRRARAGLRLWTITLQDVTQNDTFTVTVR